jgi:DNA polymerase
MAKTMAIDIESYSAADLTEVGVHRYVEDPTFEVLLIAYSVDDGPVIVIDEKTLSNEDLERRIEFFNLLVDPAVTKYAYNAAFERSCLAKWAEEPMPPEQWKCTMVHALMCGLPGSLAAVGMALGLPEDKL